MPLKILSSVPELISEQTERTAKKETQEKSRAMYTMVREEPFQHH
jgi:hypothetical protein